MRGGRRGGGTGDVDEFVSLVCGCKCLRKAKQITHSFVLDVCTILQMMVCDTASLHRDGVFFFSPKTMATNCVPQISAHLCLC